MNFNIVRQIGGIVQIEVGGGIRDYESALKVLGIYEDTKVILGTAVLKNRELLERLQKYKKNVVVGIDARKGKVATEGWVEGSEIDAYELAEEIQGKCSRIIFTSIERDGALEGPDLEAIERMVKAVKIPVTASGGIAKLEDIKTVKKTGAHSVIVGKALYRKNFTLKEAIEAAE